MARWVLVSDRQPEKPGKYEICRAKGGPLPGYLWNGSYWVTPGHNPTDAVYSWFELDAEDKKKTAGAATPTAERGVHMKSTSNYTTSQRKIKALTILLALVLAVIAFTGNYGAIRARAEESTTNAWALCKTYINIRLWPSKHATEVGFLDPCDRVEIDGRTKDGFAHVTYPVDGWVFAGYLTFSEPQEIGATYSVVARRRVAARRWIDGPQMGQKPWLINGSEVTVFYMSEDWAITSRGFVMSEYLEAAP